VASKPAPEAPAPAPEAPAPKPEAPAPAPAAPKPGTAAPKPATGTSASAAGACGGSGRSVARALAPGTTLSSQWEAKAPQDDATYDLSGVTSTAYPASHAPFAVGTESPAARTCIVGGTVRGTVDPSKTWEYYHDQANAACVTIIATEWMRVQGLRCDGVEDGIKPKESSINANNAQILVSGTYLSNIRDDCMENDYTVGGVLSDSLWDGCNTGISERPSSGNGSWSTPSSETLTLDHMLIGLQQTLHAKDGMGENRLFKWSSSSNRLVIKCSTFKVNAVSLGGKSSMTFPPGTVIDDSQCPGNPTTVVWLGGGTYPAPTPAGVRVVSQASVWTSAVSSWKAAHGY
jgi:hypothetical protein